MDSDNSWTAVGKGGRAVVFPPEAAAAFGGKFASHRGPSIPRGSGSPRSEFPADAAAAFGRKTRSAPGPKQFDGPAASAFSGGGGGGGGGVGSKSWMGVPESAEAYGDDAAAAFGSKGRRGGSEFDSAAAAAAFGGRSSRRGAPDSRSDFPDAFGKKKSAFTAAKEMGISVEGEDSYRLSAFARRKAEAEKPPEPKKQTYEEMFPSLISGGVSAAHVAPKAVAGKPTLAEIMRKRVAEEEADGARQAALERERKERERLEAIDRARLRNLRVSRVGGNYVSYADDDNTDEANADVYVPGDLDYDAYGTKRKELLAPELPVESSDSSSEDGDAEGDEY